MISTVRSSVTPQTVPLDSVETNTVNKVATVALAVFSSALVMTLAPHPHAVGIVAIIWSVTLLHLASPYSTNLIFIDDSPSFYTPYTPPVIRNRSSIVEEFVPSYRFMTTAPTQENQERRPVGYRKETDRDSFFAASSGVSSSSSILKQEEVGRPIATHPGLDGPRRGVGTRS